MSRFLFNDIDCYVKDIPYSNSVTIAYFLDVGLPSENHSQVGISHFLEHMCFRGTDQRTAYEITKQVDALGGQINAYTTKEFTCYFITLLPQNIREGFDILTDIVFRSVHHDRDVDLEKSIIGEEIKMYEDSPDEKILDVFNEVLFNKSYLGKPILGTFESISAFNSDILNSYYRRYFSPNNLKCVVAGSIDGNDEVQSLIKDFLSTISFDVDDSPRLNLRDIEFASNDFHLDKDLEQMHFCIGYPGISYNHPDRFSLTLLSTILGGSMSSRLFQSVRERSGLAYSIYSSPSFYYDTGSLMIYAGTSKENFRQAKDCVDKEIEGLLKHGISKDEFDRAKCQLRGNIIIQLEGSSAWANWLGRQFIYDTGLSNIQDIQDKLDSIKLDQLHRLLIEIFKKESQVCVSLGQL